jgi:hypothetical protein
MTSEAALMFQGAFRRPSEEAATMTAVTLQDEAFDFSSKPKEGNPVEQQSLAYALVVLEPQTRSNLRRSLSESKGIPRVASSDVLSFVVTEDQSWDPRAAENTTSMCRLLWHYTESEAKPLRGVFSPNYNRKVLFSQEIEIQTAKLPRWKPHITLERRALEREDA